MGTFNITTKKLYLKLDIVYFVFFYYYFALVCHFVSFLVLYLCSKATTTINMYSCGVIETHPSIGWKIPGASPGKSVLLVFLDHKMM